MSSLDQVLVDFAHPLRIARPLTHNVARRLVADAVTRRPDPAEHLGAIYGADKDRVLGKVDVFLPQSRFADRAAPSIVEESATQGCVAADVTAEVLADGVRAAVQTPVCGDPTSWKRSADVQRARHRRSRAGRSAAIASLGLGDRC